MTLATGWLTLIKAGAVVGTLAGVVLGVLAYGEHERGRGYDAGKAAAQGRADAEVIRQLRDATARANAATRERDELAARLQEIDDAAHDRTVQAEARAAAARSDADRLRDEARRLATARLTDAAACRATTAGEAQRADAAELLLADMLGRVARRAGDYAGTADQRGSDLAECIARYNAIRASLSALSASIPLGGRGD